MSTSSHCDENWFRQYSSVGMVVVAISSMCTEYLREGNLRITQVVTKLVLSECKQTEKPHAHTHTLWGVSLSAVELHSNNRNGGRCEWRKCSDEWQQQTDLGSTQCRRKQSKSLSMLTGGFVFGSWLRINEIKRTTDNYDETTTNGKETKKLRWSEQVKKQEAKVTKTKNKTWNRQKKKNMFQSGFYRICVNDDFKK